MLGYSNGSHQATWKIAKLLVTLLLIVCSLPAHNTAAIIKQASSSLTGLHRSSHILSVFKLHERFCNLIGASRNGAVGIESFDPPMLPGPISLLGGSHYTGYIGCVYIVTGYIWHWKDKMEKKFFAVCWWHCIDDSSLEQTTAEIYQKQEDI